MRNMENLPFRRRTPVRLAAIVSIALLAGALAGCVSDTTQNTNTNTGSGDGADAPMKSIVVGMPSGWTGEMVRSYMVAKVIEDQFDYDVTVEALDAGPIYEGLAGGSVDVFVGAWLPLQQEHYESVQDDVTILGDNLPSDAVGLYLAVPQYLYDQGIQSIADLDENRDLFDGKITGIESGAGMMITAKNRMTDWDIYGLGDWELVDSSTGAMLAAYDAAVGNNDPIVVTIWKPHYAYAKWQGEDAMVNLADPGDEVDGETKYYYADQTEAAHIQTLVPNNFETEHPEVAAFLKNFQVPGDHEDAYMLEVNELAESGAKNPEMTVAHNYVEAHPELVSSWVG